MNLSETKTHFSGVVGSVERMGETVLIGRRILPTAGISSFPNLNDSGARQLTVIGWGKGSGVRILQHVTGSVMAEGECAMRR